MSKERSFPCWNTSQQAFVYHEPSSCQQEWCREAACPKHQLSSETVLKTDLPLSCQKIKSLATEGDSPAAAQTFPIQNALFLHLGPSKPTGLHCNRALIVWVLGNERSREFQLISISNAQQWFNQQAHSLRVQTLEKGLYWTFGFHCTSRNSSAI